MLNALEQKLADLLESGIYMQAQGQLKDGDKFCCLGVLCDISGLGEWEDEVFNVPSDDPEWCNHEESVLPSVVQKAINWFSSDAMLNIRDRDGFWQKLTDLNDDGFTFPQIADIIRAGLVRRKDEKVEV